MGRSETLPAEGKALAELKERYDREMPLLPNIHQIHDMVTSVRPVGLKSVREYLRVGILKDVPRRRFGKSLLYDREAIHEKPTSRVVLVYQAVCLGRP
jgi:hypothetical protein